MVPLAGAQRYALLADDLLDHQEELLLRGQGLLHPRQLVQIDPLDQFLMDGRLDLLLYAVAHRAHNATAALIGLA